MRKTVLLCQMIPAGGGTAFTFGLARGLRQNGCDVYLVLSDKLEARESWEALFGQDHIFYVCTHTSAKNLISRFTSFLLRGIPALKKKFGGISFDLLIHTMYHSWNPWIERALKIRRVAAIDHDPVPHTGVPYLRRKRCLRYYRRMPEVIVLSRAFVETETEQYGHPKDQVYYMPHGRMDQYVPEVLPEPLLTGDGVQFLFFGYAVPYKGLGVLADAYRIVAAERPGKSTLTVASNGDFTPWADAYRSLPATTVYNRYIENEEIPAFFASSRVVAVLPYLDATQSGVIPIAMEFGVPVVATRTGGLTEQLDGGKIGIFAEPGDAASLASAMLRYIDDSAEYARQREKMYALRDSLDWGAVSERLLGQMFPEQ